MRLTKHTFILAVLVTVAVTFGSQSFGQATAPAAGVAYAPVLVNMKTGQQAIYKKRFPDKGSCDAALGNLNTILTQAVADPDKTPDPNGDQTLVEAVASLLMQIVMNTGVMPTLQISCELQGDPA